MKRLSAIGLALVLGSLVSPWAGAEDFQAGTKLRVNTASAALRDTPRPFGAKTLQTLKLGDSVVFKSKSGAWLEVEHDGARGFLPANSVAEAKKFSASSLVSRVNDSDLAAATKGFSPEIEDRNRKENAQLRYDLMDQAEKLSHVPEPMNATAAFRKEGLLGEFSKEAAQ